MGLTHGEGCVAAGRERRTPLRGASFSAAAPARLFFVDHFRLLLDFTQGQKCREKNSLLNTFSGNESNKATRSLCLYMLAPRPPPPSFAIMPSPSAPLHFPTKAPWPPPPRKPSKHPVANNQDDLPLPAPLHQLRPPSALGPKAHEVREDQPDEVWTCRGWEEVEAEGIEEPSGVDEARVFLHRQREVSQAHREHGAECGEGVEEGVEGEVEGESGEGGAEGDQVRVCRGEIFGREGEGAEPWSEEGDQGDEDVRVREVGEVEEGEGGEGRIEEGFKKYVVERGGMYVELEVGEVEKWGRFEGWLGGGTKRNGVEHC